MDGRNVKMKHPGSQSEGRMPAVKRRIHGQRAPLTRNPNAPWATLEAWYAHQYDPGYYFAGRFFPFMLGPRPNRFGYTLVVAGGVGSLLMVLIISGALFELLTEGITSGMTSWTAGIVLITMVSVLAWNAAIVASGVRLLLPCRSIRHRRRRVVVRRER